MSIVFACIALCVATVCAYPWWHYRRARRLLSHLPSMPALPLFGNLHFFLGDTETFVHQLTTGSKMMDSLKSSFVTWLGPIPFLYPSITDPQELKAVATTYLDKPYQYRFSKSFTNGLITSNGKLWKYTSKKLAGAYSGKVVSEYQGILSTQAQKLVEEMKTEIGKEPFNAYKKYINWIAFEAICHTTFGVSSLSEWCNIEEYHSALSRAQYLWCKRCALVPFHNDFLYGFTADAKEISRLEKCVSETAQKVIDKRKQERQENLNAGTVEENNSEENGKSDYKPYVDILLDLHESDPVFTQEQIMAELNTIIAAGHDTVANTLSICLILLGSHPDVQDKLYAEMKSIFKDSKRPVTKKDLTMMPYCEMVINETLRLYPAIPICFRNADKDLNLGKCIIPKDTICGINIWGAGRSKNNWGYDAEIFRPERWTEFPAGQTPLFIPFSYGKRVCSGKQYALTLLKTSLAHIIRELVIKSEINNMRLRVVITLQPYKGNKIQVFERRESATT